ncbi:MAG: histidinol-phosphate transaminase [Chitinophagaceae bacterium]|nr:MAG: histidinol-phosphate transaminase [Chitinophagaceae bacterium]
MFDLDKLVRPNIKALKPYSSARSEFSGSASVFLDANENSFGSPLTKWYNRYPDPLQWELKRKIQAIKNVPAESMLLGNGSDECIDLLIRAFCEPGIDRILVCPPTYGMYEVYAQVNNVPVDFVPLRAEDFQLDLEGIEGALTASTKLIFLCSPNNPTGNSLYREDIEMILNNFDNLVVVDEAYINYSRNRSFLSELKDYPNLVVLQTFSKAWGLAALRLGVTYASPALIDVLNKIKPPYNINAATQEIALKALEGLEEVNSMIRETVQERSALSDALAALPFVQKIFPTDANFLLARMTDATAVYEYLRDRGIIVRNRSNVLLCDDCLRITVGTPGQDEKLINALKEYTNA